MSKRFGRNQKRKLKEQIQSLQHQLQRDGLSTNHLSTELRNLKDSVRYWDDRICRLLGTESAYRFETSHNQRNDYSTPEVRHCKPHKLTSTTNYDVPNISESLTITLRKLEVSVESSSDEYNRQVAKIALAVGCDRVNYYLSSELLESVGLDREEIKYVTTQVVEELVKLLNSKFKRTCK